MQAQPIRTHADAYADPLNVIGVKITVLSSREQTGSHEVTLQEGDAGVGPPPHAHGWDESFYVLRGSVDCVVDGQAVRGTAGSFIHVPANTVHTFHFGPGGGAMLEIAGAGGNATAMFRRLSADIDPRQPDFGKVVGIMDEHGVRLAG
jgi:quercetin dioxygenase-like cupin family protein